MTFQQDDFRVTAAATRNPAQQQASAGEVPEIQAGQPATYVGVDGSWALSCQVIENIEGWWLVRFRDHTEINPSEAIVRPSSLRARVTVKGGE